MFDPLIIICALVCGIVARVLGLPALIGYLAAGFVLHELGATEGALLSQLADVGVTLLLFSIGLKLKPADLLESKVWGTTASHMLVTILALAPLLMVLMGMLADTNGFGWTQAIVLAFAMSFSSTVFAIQVLQERGEMASQHASLGIGVLLHLHLDKQRNRGQSVAVDQLLHRAGCAGSQLRARSDQHESFGQPRHLPAGSQRAVNTRIGGVF